MSTVHRAAPDVERGADDLINSKRLCANCCADDIDDRINRTDLVEVDGLHGDVVNLRFSCAECFFSGNRTDVAESVSFGLAGTLVFGPHPSYAPVELFSLQARLKRLYDKRSAATHHAHHAHVFEHEVAELSQWIAWMMLNMLAFMNAGESSLTRISTEGWSTWRARSE